MVRLFVTVSFRGKQNKRDIEDICGFASAAGFNAFCFVRDIEHYQSIFLDKELMSRVKSEIEKSDALLLQIDDSPTGRLIEAGIAYALGKPIITIAPKKYEIKKTVSGISKIVIQYENNTDLEEKLITAEKYIREEIKLKKK